MQNWWNDSEPITSYHYITPLHHTITSHHYITPLHHTITSHHYITPLHHTITSHQNFKDIAQHSFPGFIHDNYTLHECAACSHCEKSIIKFCSFLGSHCMSFLSSIIWNRNDMVHVRQVPCTPNIPIQIFHKVVLLP